MKTIIALLITLSVFSQNERLEKVFEKADSTFNVITGADEYLRLFNESEINKTNKIFILQFYYEGELYDTHITKNKKTVELLVQKFVLKRKKKHQLTIKQLNLEKSN